jgi:hypothetical protein
MDGKDNSETFPQSSPSAFKRTFVEHHISELMSAKLWADMTEAERTELVKRVDEFSTWAVLEARRMVISRGAALQKKLVDACAITLDQANTLLFGPNTLDRTKLERSAAVSLRGHLDKLRTSGAAPVRFKNMLSQLEISELAVALLDYDTAPKPAPELVDLITELLGVARHRGARFKKDHQPEWIAAAMWDGQRGREGQKALTVRELARLTGASVGSISGWRKQKAYKHLVQQLMDEEVEPLFNHYPSGDISVWIVPRAFSSK